MSIDAEPVLAPGTPVFVHCISLEGLGEVVETTLQRNGPLYAVRIGGRVEHVCWGGLSSLEGLPQRPACNYVAPGGLA